MYNREMETMLKKKLRILLDNLCCSHCKNSFDEDSVTLLQKEKGLFVINLICKKCGKDFGIAFIGTQSTISKSTPLEIQDGPEPINYNDVIDAHRFIKDLDEHWKERIKEIDINPMPDKF